MHDHYIDHTTLTKGCCSKLFVCLSCEKITNFTTFKHDIDTTQTADVILVLSSIFRCYNYRVSRLSNIIQCNKKLMLFEFLALYHIIYLCHWGRLQEYYSPFNCPIPVCMPYNTAIWHKWPKLTSIITRGLYRDFFLS